MNTCTLRVLGALVVVAVALATSANASAPTGRYVVANGGTANGTVYDTKTKLTWQQAIPSTTYAWTDAKSYCAGINLAGTGWRLPTCKELQTIVDDSQTNPAVDLNAFPSTPADWFWSSSPLAGSPSNAWGVDFGIGYAFNYDITNAKYVRCVR
jgi:formylglycine-generating enzyme required for sulfatase activity